MALLVGFERVVPKRPKLHPTRVVGHWAVLPDSGKGPIFQIDTRGSDERANPDKQSQTLQLTVDTAKELHEILKREFGF